MRTLGRVRAIPQGLQRLRRYLIRQPLRAATFPRGEGFYFLTLSIHTSLPSQTVARHRPQTRQPSKGVLWPMD